MPNFRELLTAAKSEIREVTTAEAETLISDGAALLDVREADEFEQGAVPDSIFLPRGHLEAQVEGRLVDKSKAVVVMCAGGVRSAFAARTLAACSNSCGALIWACRSRSGNDGVWAGVDELAEPIRIATIAP